jgi:hypothetical protein
MDLAAFNPPDYGLIDSDPLTFKQQFQAFYDALRAHQVDPGDLETVNSQLKTQLQEANNQVQESQQLAQQNSEALAAAQTQHGVAVAAYRQAMLNGDPSIPPDLVAGETVQDIDSSLTKARGVVDYVRDKIQSKGGEGNPGQTATAPTAPPRVPAGAPGRTLPDISGMTAREKLIFGTSRQSA